MDKGYFKVHRKLFQNPIWKIKPYSKGQALIELIGSANHTSQVIVLGNEELEIGRGQLHTSELKLAEKWGWSRKRVRTYLEQLERLKMVTTVGTSKGTTITIENYELYQSDGTADDTTHRTLKGQRRNSAGTSQGTQTKNVKNDKNVKNEKEIYIGLPAELHEPIEAFMEMRKNIKKPLTDRAFKMILKKLDELSEGDTQISIDILNQSTMNCWAGVFPLKKENQTKSKEKEESRDNDKYDYDKYFIN